MLYNSNLLIIPNLSLKGVDKLPTLVVAPTNVNFGKSKRIDLALEPFPIIISKVKSSNAGYNISSTFLFILWISSINKTSFSDNVVNMAAKSPGFSIAGPDVTFILVFISFANIFASVVFPNPGGPYNKTWSNGCSLFLAASIHIFIFSFTLSCPIYSFKNFGLNESSCVSSISSLTSGTNKFSSKSLSS